MAEDKAVEQKGIKVPVDILTINQKRDQMGPPGPSEDFVPLVDELESLKERFKGKLKSRKEINGIPVELDFEHQLQPDQKPNGEPCGFHHNLHGQSYEKLRMEKTKLGPDGMYVAKWFNGSGWRIHHFFQII